MIPCSNTLDVLMQKVYLIGENNDTDSTSGQKFKLTLTGYLRSDKKEEVRTKQNDKTLQLFSNSSTF